MSTIRIQDVENPHNDATTENVNENPLETDSSKIEDQEFHYSDFELPSPPQLKFGLFCNVLSNMLFMLDIGSDLYTASVFLTNSYWGYFALTLTFVLVPAVSTTKLVNLWYEKAEKRETNYKIRILTRGSKTEKTLTLFLMAPVAQSLRTFNWCRMALREQNNEDVRKSCFKRYTDENEKLIGVKLVEAFLESAPQATLQLYILVYHFNDTANRPYDSVIAQAAVIGISLLSLSVTLASHNRCLRQWLYVLEGKASPVISWWGSFLVFLWALCTVGARIIALAAFAVTSLLLLLPICIVHVVLMYVLCIKLFHQPKVHSNIEHPQKLCLLLAFVSIFTFYVYDELPGRNQKMVLYFGFMFVENTLLLFTWFFYWVPALQFTSLQISGLAGHYTLFFMGVLLLFSYYKYFHLKNSKWFERSEEDKKRYYNKNDWELFMREDQSLDNQDDNVGSNTQPYGEEDQDESHDGELDNKPV